jgi:serine/threonine-protein kinase
MGTPSYMSPEQCQGRDSDHRTDLCSAGVVLYELLTGERPFTGSPELIAYKICHEAPRPAAQLSPLPLPPALDDVLDTALAKAPELRFQNALAFRNALQAVAGVSAASGAGVEATVINLARVALDPAPSQRSEWDDTTLSTVERQLAHYVGPLAKVLVRKAATQTHDIAELYSLLAANIDDRDERQHFVSARPGGDSGSVRVVHTGSLAANAGGATQQRTARLGTVAQERSTSGTRARPTQPLENDFVQTTTQRLAVYLGPIARVVARKAAEKAANQQEFVQLVAGHIGTQDRAAFLRDVGYELD